jgi:hypothetical protein
VSLQVSGTDSKTTTAVFEGSAESAAPAPGQSVSEFIAGIPPSARPHTAASGGGAVLPVLVLLVRAALRLAPVAAVLPRRGLPFLI